MMTNAKSMNTPFCRITLRRLLLGLLLIASLASWLPGVRAQSTLANNNAQHGDFQGTETAHSWTVDLPEDFNDFRLQVQSPTANVILVVIPAGRERRIPLKAMPRKGGVGSSGIGGKDIEAFSEGKLAKGRYTIQITPRDDQPAGKYSIKVVEPKLAQEPPKAEGTPLPNSGPPPSPTPQSKPDAEIHAQILAELKALREQTQAMERRLAAIEAALKEK